MKTHQWRIEMRLAPGGRELMRFLMKREGLTIERLAEKCGGRRRMSSIGHLLTGYRTSCGDDLALAIEDALGVKGDDNFRIFVPRVSRVAGNTAMPTHTPNGRAGRPAAA